MSELNKTASIDKNNPPPTPNHLYTHHEVAKELKNLIRETFKYNYIKYGIKIPIEIVSTRTGSYFMHDIHKNEFKIGLGIKPILQYSYEGTLVRNKDFVRSIKSLMHEEQHLCQQKELFQHTTSDTDSKIMAAQNAICTVFPEYYETCYFHSNLYEINAEKQALINTRDYFKANHPEINVEQELVNIINSYRTWYAEHPVTSFDDAIDKLNTAFDRAKNMPIIINPENFKDRAPSPAYQLFFQDISLDEYNKLSGSEQRERLLKFIGKNAPSQITGYKVLSDIPTADCEDKIKEDETRPFRPLQKVPDISNVKFENSNNLQLT